MIMKNLTAKYW